MTSRIELAKKICKEHGIKGFRKLKLKRTIYTAGKQTVKVNKHIALRLLDKLEQEGFYISDIKTQRELAEKNMFDSFSIYFYMEGL